MKTYYLGVLVLCWIMLLHQWSGGCRICQPYHIGTGGIGRKTRRQLHCKPDNRICPTCRPVHRSFDGSPASGNGILMRTVPLMIQPPTRFMSIQFPGLHGHPDGAECGGIGDTGLKVRYITVKRSEASIRIEELKHYIQGLPIPSWVKWFLYMPLDRALDQVEKGHSKPAINQMKTFIKSVEVFLDRFHLITHGQARYMTAEARVIINLIPGKVIIRRIFTFLLW